ncbi:MAG: hypothetical protein JSW71_02590 [Gemmatimonadota bacterium]|nr:MAG: hypothetical protein JSW71_02590 [Gemmatimonadota bacterium]
MSELNEVIRQLKEALDRIDLSLAWENLPVAAIEEFKMVLDDVRTSLLALVAAGGPSDYNRSLRRLRMRRATQICENTLASLVGGTITPRTPEYAELKSTATETLEQVGPLVET